MPLVTRNEVHAVVTRGNKRAYLFTTKHHGGTRSAAQWLVSLTLEEEFDVFDSADFNEIEDAKLHLYGLRPDGAGGLASVGSRKEQIAKFPVCPADRPWHGYPVYPLLKAGSENRRGSHGKSGNEVFRKMRIAGLITEGQERRLMRGDYA